MFKALAALSMVGAALSASIPSGADSRPKSLPFPNITAVLETNLDAARASYAGIANEMRDTYTYTPANSTEDKRSEPLQKRCASTSIMTWGDSDTGGPGIFITNAGSDWRGFYFFENSCDSTPYKYVWINAGETQFISLPSYFQGRVQRGVDNTMLDGSTHLLGSWMEFSFTDGTIWGDISVIRGCDGAVLMWDPDNGNAWSGFTQYILEGAPYGSYDLKDDGQWVIGATEQLGNTANVYTTPRDWDAANIDGSYTHVFIDDWHNDECKAVISSSSGRFKSYWPDGRP